MTSPTFEEWLEAGVAAGYVLPDVRCAMHDGPPLTPEELEQFDEHGADPCVPVLRLLPC